MKFNIVFYCVSSFVFGFGVATVLCKAKFEEEKIERTKLQTMTEGIDKDGRFLERGTLRDYTVKYEEIDCE